jgi:hypothetical protein
VRKSKAKRSASQIFFVAFVIATVTTIGNYVIDWSTRIYAGIFAGLVSLAAIWLADLLFEKSND